MTIRFHPHALQRIQERFGFNEQLIPMRQIEAMARRTKIDQRFRLFYQGITFVCVRDTTNTVLVITVFPDNRAEAKNHEYKLLSKREWKQMATKDKRNRKRGKNYG